MSDDAHAAQREWAIQRARSRHTPMFFRVNNNLQRMMFDALLVDAERRQVSPGDVSTELLHFAIAFLYFTTLCAIEEPERMRGEFGQEYTAALKRMLPGLIDDVFKGYDGALQTYVPAKGPANDDGPRN